MHLPFNLGKVIGATAGGSACAILTSHGQVYIWGFGYLGQGPLTTTMPRPSALPMPLFGLNDFDTDSEVADIQAGSSHFAAITKNGDLYMWGRNKHGLLGIGTDKDQFFLLKVCMAGSVDRVSCGTEHTVVLTKTCI